MLTTLLVLTGLAGPARPALAQDAETSVVVPAGSETGVATGVTLATGDKVTITATGVAQTNPDFPPTGPDGLYPDGDSGPCPYGLIPCLAPTRASALLGKVGSDDWTYVGSGPSALTGIGDVRLAYNDAIGYFGDNSGAYTAVLRVTHPAPAPAPASAHACSTSTLRHPIKAGGWSTFRKGRTVRLKFACADGSLTPRLSVRALTSSFTKTGAKFRYNAVAGVYHKNLRTERLKPGRYHVRINGGDGVLIEAKIKLRRARRR